MTVRTCRQYFLIIVLIPLLLPSCISTVIRQPINDVEALKIAEKSLQETYSRVKHVSKAWEIDRHRDKWVVKCILIRGHKENKALFVSGSKRTLEMNLTGQLLKNK